MHHRHLAAAAALATLAVAPAASGQTTAVLVRTGDVPPDGNGVFTSITGTALNDAGEVAFVGALSGTADPSQGDASGAFRVGGTRGLVQVARGGQIATEDAASFTTAFGFAAINASGQLAFSANASAPVSSNPFGRSVGAGLFVGDGSAAPVAVIRPGQSAPDGNGSFTSTNTYVINDAGQTAFFNVLLQTGDRRGIFATGPNGTVELARDTGFRSVGNEPTVALQIDPLAFNRAGQAAIVAQRFNTGDGPNGFAVLVGDGSASPVPVVIQGRAAPDGDGTLVHFQRPAIDDAGRVTFVGGLTDRPDEPPVFADRFSLFQVDGGTVTLLAGVGEAAPDGNGRLGDFFGVRPAINNAGGAAFSIILTGTAAGAADDSGLFRVDAEGDLRQLAREGQAAPDGNGLLADFGTPTLNDAGQTAFLARLEATDGGAGDDTALLFHDDTLGLLTVAREGDALLGSTITGLTFSEGLADIGGSRSGFNAVGQVAYGFTLADSRTGIALFTPPAVPEPASAGLLILGGAALLRRRRA